MQRRIPWAIGSCIYLLGSAAFGAAGPTLQPGQWSLHTETTHLSGPKAGKTTVDERKICLKGDNDLQKILEPDLSGKTNCETFTYRQNKSYYRTVMQCRHVSKNMSGKILKNFTVVPGLVTNPESQTKSDKNDDKKKDEQDAESQKNNVLFLNGKVHQRLTGTPVQAPTNSLKVSIRARRVGSCDDN